MLSLVCFMGRFEVASLFLRLEIIVKKNYLSKFEEINTTSLSDSNDPLREALSEPSQCISQLLLAI